MPLLVRQIVAVLVIAVVVGGIWWGVVALRHHHATTSFAITSQEFQNNQALPVTYTCSGENVNPPFAIANPPAGTKSFALLMEDTTKSDHPVHWMIWNIPGSTTTIMEGIRPAGTVARSYAGNFGYSGPCPPVGETHTYVIHLYALTSETLELNSGASVSDFQKAVRSALAEARLTTSYKGTTP